MLSIDISHAASFLSLPYEAALRPRLERAAGWLQNGGGKGSDFIGWVTLPRDYDRGEYARILAAAKKIQGDSKALVVIGIGGSYLGARGVIECLCSPNYNLKKKSTPNIYFIGNGLSDRAARGDLSSSATTIVPSTSLQVQHDDRAPPSRSLPSRKNTGKTRRHHHDSVLDRRGSSPSPSRALIWMNSWAARRR